MSKLTLAKIKEMADKGRLDASVFDQAEGETTAKGGALLSLNPGDVGGPFRYVGTRTAKMPDGDEVEAHTAEDRDGLAVGMPLSASFGNQIAELKVNKGDVFLVKREADATKKKGKGKGATMKIFRVKVLSRS